MHRQRSLRPRSTTGTHDKGKPGPRKAPRYLAAAPLALLVVEAVLIPILREPRRVDVHVPLRADGRALRRVDEMNLKFRVPTATLIHLPAESSSCRSCYLPRMHVLWPNSVISAPGLIFTVVSHSNRSCQSPGEPRGVRPMSAWELRPACPECTTR